MRFLNNKVITGSAMNATVASSAIDASNLLSISGQFIITGVTTATGNMSLQASNDALVPTNWSNLTTTALAGNGVYLISKVDLCYKWVRLIYVPTVNDAGATVSCNVEAIGI